MAGWHFPEYPSDWKYRRKDVLRRDGYRCVRCGGNSCRLDVDHIIPLSKGGTNDYSNLQTLCINCHMQKHPHMRETTYNHYRRNDDTDTLLMIAGFITVIVLSYLGINAIVNNTAISVGIGFALAIAMAIKRTSRQVMAIIGGIAIVFLIGLFIFAIVSAFF